ncbi:hypothetical protein EDC04DRAFT_2871005 [Pisolithus marmoratus]|nr:hypothetical protein EDC04DRAFT_2871005 [Pisolithus marmoratus]
MALKLAAIEGHDPHGTKPNFETYLYYAKQQREKEAAESKSDDVERGFWANLLWGKTNERLAPTNLPDDKKGGVARSVSDAEYRAASSALRTASWGSVFYLITTDILGPYTTPWAFSQVGYGPGVACFIAFAIMAAYSGLLLWYMFMKLDSDKHPLRSFGDLAYRIYGGWFRHVCNVLQSLQLIFNVGLIILSNGQGLSQMAKFKLCFSVCNIVWMLSGSNDTRTNQNSRKFSWIANFAIWLNVITMIMTMGAVANTPPNYQGGWPSTWSPFRQWLLTTSPSRIANQGIFPLQPQTATKCYLSHLWPYRRCLVGNIGVKVIYNNILVELFMAPPLTVKSGKYLFAVSIIVYWALAYVIGSAVPQFTNISALVAAVCIFQFSYTFPPFMFLGFVMQQTALQGDKSYDVNNPHGSRVDTWKTGLVGDELHIVFNLWNFIITLACVATAVLAAYSAIKSIITIFHTAGSPTSFGCKSPVQ